MRIGLVADIPDQPIIRRVEDMMQRDRQLHDAEARAEMTAGQGHGVDQLCAQLSGKLRQIAFGQKPEVGGDLDLVKERRCWFGVHSVGSLEVEQEGTGFGGIFVGITGLPAECKCVAGSQPSGSGMNSLSSPGTMSKRPVFHSSLACSMRSFEEDTKFHQI